MNQNHPNRSKVPDWPSYVKQFRERHNLSQVLLAAKLRVEETTVQRWEAGERKPAPYLKRALRDLTRELETTN
jgi:DNA-binding transcriptional regulator YiaG